MTQITTEKGAARMTAEALEAYGVRRVFVCPGSRNAPLIMALARSSMHASTVVDERSAAFIALGYALVAREPVAVVCTSGSAVLNFAPAVAEAYYRKVPLIVVSADRPAEWIGQDDSQTIRQPGALQAVVKASYNIKGEIASHREQWLANRTLNEAMHTALYNRRGPVHINISFDAPLSQTVANATPLFRKIGLIQPSDKLDVEQARVLGAEALNRSILIAGGFCQPSSQLNKAMSLLASTPGVVVVADALANVNAPRIIDKPALLFGTDAAASLPKPGLLITFGGSMLSQQLKDWLRATDFAEHWHVGDNAALIDSYFSLTRRIEIGEEEFFPRWSRALQHLKRAENACADHRFSADWLDAYAQAVKAADNHPASLQWSERSAITQLLRQLPSRWNLQLSNGLTPRYATMAEASRFHRRDCNRGVSGIDGSVSTAVGASLAYSDTTVLITGDMSLQYDLAALSSGLLSSRLKIVVISNNGGGIFRKIATTRSLPERDRFFCCDLNLNLPILAEAFGADYLEASSEGELRAAIKDFTADTGHSSILNIKTNHTS